MSESSIFSKIVSGEVPSHKIYEDEKTFAFLDIYAVVDGHTLVIPKKEVEFIWDLPDEDYQAVMNTVQKVGKRIREVLDVQFVGIKVVGTDVPHSHVHLIPFNTSGIFHQAAMINKDEPDHEKLAATAEKLRFSD
jgi:histidine triad (HIT) family protein